MALLIAAGVALLLLDQWSKRAARLRAGDRIFWCGGFFQVRYVTHLNNLYQSKSVRILLVTFWFLSFLGAMLLRHSGLWFQTSSASLGLGLAFGGAGGNLLDMLQHRYVVDFVDLKWWPVFNLADVGIVGGLILAFWR